MSRLLPVWLAVACAAPAPDTDPPPDTDPVPGGTDGPPRPPLPLPPEAEDLDPAPDVLEVRLEAAPHTFSIGGETVEGYAYNGSVPGPTLRARVGDTLVATVINRLDVPTTVHWHGAGAPYPMDGVTWTEDPIAPGETFVATFRLTRAGTFWYHPHFDTARQVDLGLYGALIVEDPDEPAVDHDVVVLADSWGEAGSRTPSEGADHHGLDGADLAWTFNGALDPVLPVGAGETVRLRLIDVSNTGYLDLRTTEGIRFVAGDQGLWGTPRAQAPVMGPGDRLEAEVRPGGAPEHLELLPYSLYGGPTGEGDPVARLSVVPDGPAPRPAPIAWPIAPAPPSPDPGRTDLRFVLQGDATEPAWFINGEVFPDVTVPRLALDDDVIVEVRNVSPTEHPFHMHGHAFEILSRDGVPALERQVEDTVNVRIRETLRLRFRATLPGFWMTHCHILPHADGGMMTVVEVR